MAMSDDLKSIEAQVEEGLKRAETMEALEALRVSMLGRKGRLTALMHTMGQVPPEERRAMGQMANTVRAKVEAGITARREELANELLERRMAADAVDVTLPGRTLSPGTQHLINQIREEIEDIFCGLGYTVEDGPYVETTYYNFTALNAPEDHPSRSARDTFYVVDNAPEGKETHVQGESDILLRTHTSSIQVRTMEHQRPPIRVICPGRVFRNEAISYRAHCIFHQIEGLYIDERVSFADLKQSLLFFAKELFGEQTAIRMRPSYFPFTEPSAEVDVSCNLCGGKGCPVCKGTGWLEILGCGMVDPNVLEANGIDPQKYSGFAFGMGIERIAMLKYGVGDLRLYFENDVRFLRQFDTELD